MRKKLQLLLAATLLILYASCSTPVPGPAEVDPAEPPELGELNNFPEDEGELLQNYLTVANYAKAMSAYADALESYISILKSMIADIQ